MPHTEHNPNAPSAREVGATVAVIPLKRLTDAKQRLKPILSPEERAALMLAMLEDVVDAAVRAHGIAHVLLVSREPAAREIAGFFGASVFAESPGADLSSALDQAAVSLAGRGVGAMLMLPADVPLVTPAEIEAITGTDAEVVLVPDSDGEGTNALFCAPPDLLPLCFDGHSFKPHTQRAYDAGVTPRILQPEGLLLDIDTPGDLITLCRRRPRGATGRFLAGRDILGRVRERLSG